MAIVLEQPAVLSLCFKSGFPVMKPSLLPVFIFLALTGYVNWVVSRVWFSALSSLMLCTYALLCIVDPGEVPSIPSNRLYPLYSSAPAKTICPFCRIHRPARTYHCSACNHCISKYDHHCPWIRNCVGGRTLGLFYLFLTLLLAALTIAGIDLGLRFYNVMDVWKKERKERELAYLLPALFLTTLVWTSVFYLFCVFTKNFFVGKTSFERLSRSHLEDLDRDIEPKGDYPGTCLDMCCNRSPSSLQTPLLG